MEYRNNLHSALRDYRSYGAPSSPANCGGCRLRRAAVWVIQTVQHDGNDVPIKNQYLLRRIYLPGGSKLQPPFRRHFLLRRRYDGGSGCNFGSGFSGSGGGRSTALIPLCWALNNPKLGSKSDPKNGKSKNQSKLDFYVVRQLAYGHVDGTGEIVSVVPEGDSLWVKVKTLPELLKFIVPKGFIAMDGTSVTVVNVFEEEDCFDFMLVAYTQQQVVIPLKKVGQKVNLEIDILGKYVARFLRSGFVDATETS
ncbi:hypothetical protein ACLOJK_040546 [Asimina triloba]